MSTISIRPLTAWCAQNEAEISHSYDNFTYFMMGQLNINPGEFAAPVHLLLHGHPEVPNLQGVYDLSDAQNISHGNPNLKPPLLRTG